MSDDKELEDLDALTKAPGWLRYRNALMQEWTGKYDDYVTLALNGKGDALNELIRLAAGRTAVLAALSYPETRIRQLQEAGKQRTLETVMARGGLP